MHALTRLGAPTRLRPNGVPRPWSLPDVSQRPQSTPSFSPELDIGSLFEAATREDWLALVERGLKGGDFETELVTPGLDGIDRQPLYAAGDVPAGARREAAWIGERPGRGWTICQAYRHPDPLEVRRRIRLDLDRGLEGAWLRLDRATRWGLRPDHPDWPAAASVDGILLASAADLERLLEDLPLERLHLAFQAGQAAPEIGRALAEIARRRGIEPARLHLALDCDPLATLAADGRLRLDPPGERSEAVAGETGGEASASERDALAALLDRAIADWPRGAEEVRARTIGVSTLAYHHAGASLAQELAFAMATGLAYLRALSMAGRSAATACDQIRFTFAVDADGFGSMAKLRAARRLWCRILRGLDGNSEQAGAMQIHATGSPRSLQDRDPWVNILRGTQQALAAVVGGADQVSLPPFDSASGPAGELGRRLALNTQSILRLEAHLHRLADPAGGSHYLESLTDRVAREAWRLFGQIEAAGGMLEALRSGRVQQWTRQSAAFRREEIASGRRSIIGVTRYPPPEGQPSPASTEVEREALVDRARRAFERAEVPQDGAGRFFGAGAEPKRAGQPSSELSIERLESFRDGADPAGGQDG